MKDTLLDYFLSLVRIDSESKYEKALALKLKADLEKLGFQVQFDKANEETGGEIGNLIAFLPGKPDSAPIMLCAHLDTVVPGKGIKPIVKDGCVMSDGTTILGADDKSGIVQIIWAIKELIESKEELPPIEILFTVSEEIGLLGSKNCDYTLLRAKKCYAFDSHNVGSIMKGAPSQNNLHFVIHGRKAHAGVEPEKGLNAIRIAAEAISSMPLGRIDEETTCNIGIIRGGTAPNVVPDHVEIVGEIRSHSEQKMQNLTNTICDTFRNVTDKYRVNGYRAEVDLSIEKSYTAFLIDEDNCLIDLARKASRKIGLPELVYQGGGGSDANILNLNGIETVVIGTGMDEVHTLQENITVSSLEKGVLWTKELIKLYGKECN